MAVRKRTAAETKDAKKREADWQRRREAEKPEEEPATGGGAVDEVQYEREGFMCRNCLAGAEDEKYPGMWFCHRYPPRLVRSRYEDGPEAVSVFPVLAGEDAWCLDAIPMELPDADEATKGRDERS